MFDNFFKRNNIDIKPYLKYYTDTKIPDFVKGFEKNCNLNPVNNTIICTPKVAKELSDLAIDTYTKGKNKDKNYIDFNKIIPIRDNPNFSYKMVEQCWGANTDDDGVVESFITEDRLIAILFSTRYLPPIQIINMLLSKYKGEIIWFTIKSSYKDDEKEYFYYWNKNHVKILGGKTPTKEEHKEVEDNKYSLQFFIPYHAVYYGTYINCYAKDSKSEKYICSCQREALKNKLLMFDDYMVHDYCLNDRKELLLKYLGLPDYYENIIKSAPEVTNYVNYFDLFKFKDKLCPICNKVKVPDLSFYLNYRTSKFRQRYIGEIERLYSINGIIDPLHIYQGNYYLENLLSDNNKKLLKISDSELLNELKTYNLNCNIEKEIEKFNKLNDETKKLIKCALHYDKNNNSFRCDNLAQEKNIDLDFIDAIQDIYDRKLKIIKSSINDDIHKFDKNAMDYKTLIKPDFGLNIYLKKNEDILHIELWTDVLQITEYDGKKKSINTYQSNIDLFSTILEILSSDRMNMFADDTTYEEWIICNGKKREITEEDYIRGYDSPVAINHSLIYFKTHVESDPKQKNISDILDIWLPQKNEK